ncbi:hypothetical protein K413DRAFT_1207 [Clostridium sp. ASBs410]|nr:hypothetical protein K413DRAFT_1207 [Clostridium sp. ASBs410]
MKFTIDYEERVSRINSVTIEVEDEEEGEAIADELYDMADSWSHPDDIFGALGEIGKKVVERCEGAESAEYEIQ